MDVSAKIGLPPVVKIRLRSEVDYYGLSSIVAGKLQVGKAPRSFATWRHGWVFMPLRYSAQLIWADHDAPFHLVATQKEVSFLAVQGFENVVAAGLPFIYADIDNVERLPGSLLVMPPHTLAYVESGMNEAAYVEYIMSISGHFSKVVFCLHTACIEKGDWCATLEKAGIDWVVGAAAHDANSLLKMQKLFRMFEYMTTCTIGSHLVYGAYCGCKVSISGAFYEYKKEAFQNDPYYLQYPEMLSYNLQHSSAAAIKGRYPFLFTPPDEAELHMDWALNETGASCRRDVQELKQYLGWSLHAQTYGLYGLIKRKLFKAKK